MSKLAGLSDVALAAGVSITTASFVVNGRAAEMRIAPKTVERVQAAVKELGYIPNIAAKKLNSTTARDAMLPDIALLWSSGMHPSFLGSFVASSRYFFELGKVPEMSINIAPFSVEGFGSRKSDYLSSRYNGVIFSPMREMEISAIGRFVEGLPFVMMHIQSDVISNVVINNKGVGKTAADIFHRRGHKSVAMVYRTTMGGTDMEDARVVGFKEMCEEKGLDCTLIEIPGGSLGSLSLRSSFGKYLAEAYLAGEYDQTAFFIQDDVVMTGFLTSIEQHGVSVPHDLELITYGNDDLAGVLCPTVTTIDYPADKLTLEALKMISERMRNPYAPPQQTVVQCGVTFRESCPQILF